MHCERKHKTEKQKKQTHENKKIYNTKNEDNEACKNITHNSNTSTTQIT